MSSSAGDSIVDVGTEAVLSTMVDALCGLPTNPPSLYIDLEGTNLSRHGTVSILQIHVLPTGRTYLVDVYTLGGRVFSTPGASSGRTLRQVLESGTEPKVFFDVRGDSDALFAHFSVRLAGIQDLQLLELAARLPGRSRRTVNGLARCLELDAPASAAERARWAAIKEAGLRLFAPERGGSYAVFEQRPLPPAVRAYCAQDVEIMPRLWAHYNTRVNAVWRERVFTESAARVALSQTPGFQSQGKHMALGPAGW